VRYEAVFYHNIVAQVAVNFALFEVQKAQHNCGQPPTDGKPNHRRRHCRQENTPTTSFGFGNQFGKKKLVKTRLDVGARGIGEVLAGCSAIWIVAI
jgi:hypothetical protein